MEGDPLHLPIGSNRVKFIRIVQDGKVFAADVFEEVHPHHPFFRAPVGARLSRRIPLEGSDLPGVLWGLDFLSAIAEGNPIRLKERVIVIGGGDVAVDAARSALRCGAKEVTMVCLEERGKMPAQAREVASALDEGVRLMNSWGPRRILGKEDRITGVELVRCLSVVNGQGVFSPRFGETSKTMEADQVILAVGQTPDLSFLREQPGIGVEGCLIVADEDTLRTGRGAVFAAGDATSAHGSIIRAIAQGRNAASAIDKALGGEGVIDEVLFKREAPSVCIGKEEGFSSRKRERASELDLSLRCRGFQEWDLGLTPDQALLEAGRCLQCDLRLLMGSNPFPLEKWLVFNWDNVSQAPESEGVFLLYGSDRQALAIRGTSNLRRDLTQALEGNESAKWFDLEEDKMYSRRESELIQRYVQEHGRMPCSGSEEDDLY